MEYRIQCECGIKIGVKQSNAGSIVRCQCGSQIVVPPLSDLMKSNGQPIPAKQAAIDSVHQQLPRELTVQLTVGHLDRIDKEALGSFAHAVLRSIERYFQSNADPISCDVQCAVGLLPRRQSFFEVQVFPAPASIDLGSALVKELEELRVPLVRNHPVGFAMRKTINGGSELEPEFESPFFRELPESYEGTWEEALSLLAEKRGITRRKRTPLWQKWKGWLVGTPAKQTPDEGYHPDIPLFPSESTLSHEEIEQAMLEYPNEFRLFGMRGRMAENEGRYEDALADYNRVVSLCADDERSWFTRAVCHYAAGNSADALRDLNEAIQRNPAFCTALLGRAQLYLELEGYEKAREDLDAAVDADPFVPYARFLRARLHFHDGEVDACVRELDRILDFAPYFIDALALKIHVQRLTQFDPDGDAELLELIELLRWLRGEDPWLLVERAQVNLVAGNLDEAIQDCEEALSIDPKFTGAYEARARIRLAMEDYHDALKDCDRVLETDGESPAVLFTQAKILANTDEFEPALASVNRSLELEEHPLALAFRAELQLILEDAEQAIRDLSKSIELAPGVADFHHRLGVAYSVAKRHDDALQELNRSIQMEPDAPIYYFSRASVYRILNKPHDALQDLNKAVELSDDNPEFQMARAHLLANMNSPEAAVQQLDKLIKQLPDFADALSMRAELSSQIKDFNQAEKDLSRLIEMYPDAPFGYTNRAAMRLRKGVINKADQDYEEAILQSPEQADSIRQHRYITEIGIKHDEEKFTDAIQIATEAIQVYPDLLTAYRLRAAAYWYDEQLVEAADDYSYCLEQLEEPDLFLLNSRGQVFAEMGEYDLALADLNRVLESDEKAGYAMLEAYSLNGRGLAHAGLQNWRDAAQDFVRSIELCPENAWTHYNQGLMYFNQKKMKEAAICFQLAMAVDGPALTPAKRAKATGFLNQCQDS